MFQDLVLAIVLVSYHNGLYILTFFLISCPENQRVIIMEFKVSLKYVPLPCDENIKHITCYHQKLNSKIEGGNLKLEGVT